MSAKYIIIVNDELVDNASTEAKAKEKLKFYVKKKTDWWAIYKCIESHQPEENKNQSNFVMR